MESPIAVNSTEQDKNAIFALIDRMAKARYDKDPQSIAASYTRDAAIFNLAPPLAHHGTDIAETQAWLDTWDGPIEIEPRNFDVTVCGDTAFLSWIHAHGCQQEGR